MPNHFSSIGFPVRGEDDIRGFVAQALEQGRTQTSPLGQIVVWELGGPELWMLVQDGAIAGCSPHFAEQSRLPVGVTALNRSPQWPMEGTLHGWASPPAPDRLQEGHYPFLVDVPDFDHLYAKVQVPQLLTLQIAAFAHELACYTDEADFYAQTKRNDDAPGFAAQSFIPSGLFTQGDTNVQPRAEAIFAGIVRQASLRVNQATGQSFYALSVETLGGIYDVVADPEIVTGTPTIGGVVQGQFWLSGRVVDGLSDVPSPPPPRSLADRLTGWMRGGASRS